VIQTISNIEVTSDQEISIRIARRDIVIFGRCYDKYAPALLGILQRMKLENESSEIIIERVFKYLWRNSHNYNQAKGTLFSWLMFITRQETQSFFKELQKHDPVANAAYETSHTVINPQEKRGAGQNKESACLTHRQLSYIEMVRVYKYTPDQIADLTKTSISEVTKTIDVAISKLKKDNDLNCM
jgi:RNA polymerase sigma-70 factor (ECF subfamily)